MSLIIDDPEVCRLAGSLTHVTGEMLSQVVGDALRAYQAGLNRPPEKASIAGLLAIARKTAVFAPGSYASHADLFYDASGLPV